MAYSVDFLAGEDFTIDSLSGSGLGFYGDGGFGAAVEINEWQGRTFITNSNGTTQGPEVDNVKYLDDASGIIGQAGSGVALTAIPNYQSTLNIRLTVDSAVQTSDGRIYGYDRYHKNNSPSGVTLMGAEIIHPSNTQVNNGSGDTSWTQLDGSSSYITLIDCPGTSGLRPNGASTSDTQHDWYAVLSASPDSIGSKTLFGLWFETNFY